MNGDSENILTVGFNGGILRNSADSTTAIFTVSGGITLGATNCDFDIDGTNGILSIPGPISGTGSLLKTGPGALDLSTNNTYTGATTISGGTLALVGVGTISNTTTINLAVPNAILDLSEATDTNATIDTILTLNNGQTLSGIGSINGDLVAPAGSTVAPGSSNAIGVLTVSNTVTLNGNLLIGLNDTNTPRSDALVSSLGMITYGGTLTVTNIGPKLQVGDSFQLFPSAVTTFSAINLATTDASGFIYTWQNHVAADGSIKVLSVQSPVSTNRTNIVFSVTGGTLSLSWPSDHLGWRLQAQTNAIGVGVSTNWVTVAGSTNVTSVNFPVTPVNGAVFYRMVYP